MPDRLTPQDLSALETFALELAKVAGEAILPLFRIDQDVEDKGRAKTGGFDPVTAADRSAEAAMRKAIAARYPHHGVIGEEYGEDRPDAEFVWVLDPIDGTRAFISGLPVWTTLIGLRHCGTPVVGAIGQSYLHEVFVGSAHGARLVRGGISRSLRTRACPDLARALIATTDPLLFLGENEAPWSRLRNAARLTRYGCDAYAYAMVALGTLDLVIETGLKAWDIEAAIPIMKGAGGFITDWQGRQIGQSGGQMLICGDERVRDEALKLLAD